MKRVVSARAFLCVPFVVACGGTAPPSESPRAAGAASARAAVAPPVVLPPRDDGRLPGGVTPVRYRWEPNVDPSPARFSGKVHILVHVVAPTRVAVLHGRGLTIRRAAFVGPFGTVAATAASRMD